MSPTAGKGSFGRNGKRSEGLLMATPSPVAWSQMVIPKKTRSHCFTSFLREGRWYTSCYTLWYTSVSSVL